MVHHFYLFYRINKVMHACSFNLLLKNTYSHAKINNLFVPYVSFINQLLHLVTATEYILYILGIGFIVVLVYVLQEPTINHATFSRSFKEWKFCQYELCRLQENAGIVNNEQNHTFEFFEAVVC